MSGHLVCMYIIHPEFSEYIFLLVNSSKRSMQIVSYSIVCLFFEARIFLNEEVSSYILRFKEFVKSLEHLVPSPCEACDRCNEPEDVVLFCCMELQGGFYRE